jgi:hypothetical protein
MNTQGTLGKYSWIIDNTGWTTLYVGDTSICGDAITAIDGFVTIDPEEAILRAIIRLRREEQQAPALETALQAHFINQGLMSE